ncbi:5752_t:CDS:1 [Acaulospora morrowiae]|uniref:5752_t:CDS:1 n=1 Tax=Acaulospora morrowiae TaxID=94023 RepID=A0A9N8YW14_9GLOM|nr:5752_t:CDS:1 [Acaulospora morrowiae]
MRIKESRVGITNLHNLFHLSVTPVLYTYYTKDDIGTIPIYCPYDYDYPRHEFLLACQIRLINFIAMWLFAGIGTLLVIFIPAGIFPLDEEERLKNKEIDFYYVWTGHKRI